MKRARTMQSNALDAALFSVVASSGALPSPLRKARSFSIQRLWFPSHLDDHGCGGDDRGTDAAQAHCWPPCAPDLSRRIAESTQTPLQRRRRLLPRQHAGYAALWRRHRPECAPPGAVGDAGRSAFPTVSALSFAVPLTRTKSKRMNVTAHKNEGAAHAGSRRVER